jgi:tetratricopeptide (TPR) repeat protein
VAGNEQGSGSVMTTAPAPIATAEKYDNAMRDAMNAFQSADFSRAKEYFEKASEVFPDYPAPITMMGAVEIRRQNLDQAATYLERALKLDPDFGLAHFHLGNCYMLASKPDAAERHFTRLVQLHPESPDSHFCLGNAHRAQGKHEVAFGHFRMSTEVEPKFVDGYTNAGLSLMDLKRFAEAAEIFERAIKVQPRAVRDYINLGSCLLEMEKFREAEKVYKRALEIDENSHEAHFGLGLSYRKQKKLKESIFEFEAVVRLRPQFGEAYYHGAKAFVDLHREEQACMLFAEAIKFLPDLADAFASYGYALNRCSRLDDAESALRRALELEPENVVAMAEMAFINQYRGDFEEAIRLLHLCLEKSPGNPGLLYRLVMIGGINPDELDEKSLLEWLRKEEAEDDSKHGQIRFLLGKIRDAEGRHDEAFEQYAAASDRFAKSSPPYSREETEKLTQGIKRNFTKATIEAMPEGNSSELPVLVFGMPRSGTTLIEQIIASHPMAEGAGEMNSWTSIEIEMEQELGTSDGYMGFAKRVDENSIKKWSESYEAELRSHSKDALRIVDKGVHNFTRLGLVSGLFPKARLIHAHRDPLDNCLSCYLQFFDYGKQTFSLRQEDVAHYYLQYQEIMDHWKEVLPVEILDVSYEETVEDLEGAARRIIDFIGLPWDDRCLEFHKTNREVRTASFWQVRQPIYSSSVGRAQRYDSELGPMKKALGL